MTLVTGGTGFIGSHLVERMLELGMPVRCLVRDRRKPRHLAGWDVELAEGELSTGAGLAGALEGVDTVFHLAGVTKAFRAPDYYSGNRDATANLLRACGKQAAIRRFVHVSTLAAVGPSPDGRALDETAEAHPVSHYGRSKWQAEELVRASDIRAAAVILRPPVVYGPRDTDVLGVFRMAARGLAVRIGQGESYFSLIHVHDLVAGVLAAADSGLGGASTYFLSNAEPVSWRAFSQAAGKALGRGIGSVAVPYWMASVAGLAAEAASRLRGRSSILSREKIREARFRYWVCDSSRARADFGFSPRLSVQDGVAQTIEWYRQAGWLA
jgi:nucleoside-diphosphate-sugar epimerase